MDGQRMTGRSFLHSDSSVKDVLKWEWKLEGNLIGKNREVWQQKYAKKVVEEILSQLPQGAGSFYFFSVRGKVRRKKAKEEKI